MCTLQLQWSFWRLRSWYRRVFGECLSSVRNRNNLLYLLWVQRRIFSWITRAVRQTRTTFEVVLFPMVTNLVHVALLEGLLKFSGLKRLQKGLWYLDCVTTVNSIQLFQHYLAVSHTVMIMHTVVIFHCFCFCLFLFLELSTQFNWL